ncbi:hypothetical protein HC823_01505 [Candidatus Gracilibacteria bacterium]|nr:hypothetical protein [Candidatus Gracilibacteria bacterium]
MILGATIGEETLSDPAPTETTELVPETISEPEETPVQISESPQESETALETTTAPTLQEVNMTLQEDPSAPTAEAAKNDPLKTLSSAQGKYDIDLFSGSPSYSFPITLPPGRDGVTPKVSLHYSGNNRKFDSLAGYGWNMTQNAIYRSTNHGVDQLYERNDFTAELNGSAQELVLIDGANQIYGAKTESSFTRYQFVENHWIATDTKGTKYVFGNSSDTQQFDPNDSSRIYKWMLERIEDLNGNSITFTYFKDGGQIYPDSIRYTGHGDELGIGEVKFLRTERPDYTSYERGFGVTTRYLIHSIETYTYHDGAVKKVLEYDFDHEVRNNAVQHLIRITMKSPDGYFPATEFSYFDGTESITDKKINLLKQIKHPYGAVQDFTYRASTAFRPGGNLSNKIPLGFIRFTRIRSHRTLVQLLRGQRMNTTVGIISLTGWMRTKKNMQGFMKLYKRALRAMGRNIISTRVRTR